MVADKNVLDDVLSLSMQLNRQAFARPPVEGWLNSFLAMMYERFASANIKGIQVAQVIGDVAVKMGSAGTVPNHASDQYPLDASSPIAAALKTRQMATAPDTRVYPIMIGDDAVGVLIAYCSEPTQIIDDALGAMAMQLGPAIMQQPKSPGSQTGRLTRQIDMMRSLYQATQTVSSALESVEVLNRGARSLVDTLHVDHAWIVVYDYAQGMGTCVAESPDSGYIGTKIQLHGSPLLERLEREQAPIEINNVAESQELGSNQELLAGFGLKALVMLPMLVEGQVIGSVAIDSFYDRRDFSPEEIEGARTITAQLAISVRNAQLYDEIKRRANQLERIADLGRSITSTFNRSTIFQLVKDQTQNLITADQISVALHPSDTDVLQVFLLDKAEPTLHTFKLAQTALRTIIDSMQPVVLDDISGSEYPDYRLLAQSDIHAAVIAPLVVGGRAIGTYNVLATQPGLYTSIDLAVVEQVSNQLAIALENARLYSQAAQRVEVERLMNRMSGGMPAQGDMQSILMMTVQQIAEALNARRARVRLEMVPPSNGSSTGSTAGSGTVSDKSEG